MKKENVVVKRNAFEHLAPSDKLVSNLFIFPPCGGSTAVRRGRRVVKSVLPLWRGWHAVPGEGVLNKANFMGTPSSPLRGTSPARGEVNGGFTLIELLVVVLIIGILAAVAVPQYNKAVLRARASEVLLVLNNYRKALELYELQNGLTSVSNEKLDIDINDPFGFRVGMDTCCEPEIDYYHVDMNTNAISINCNKDQDNGKKWWCSCYVAHPHDYKQEKIVCDYLTEEFKKINN